MLYVRLKAVNAVYSRPLHCARVAVFGERLGLSFFDAPRFLQDSMSRCYLMLNEACVCLLLPKYFPLHSAILTKNAGLAFCFFKVIFIVT